MIDDRPLCTQHISITLLSPFQIGIYQAIILLILCCGFMVKFYHISQQAKLVLRSITPRALCYLAYIQNTLQSVSETFLKLPGCKSGCQAN